MLRTGLNFALSISLAVAGCASAPVGEIEPGERPKSSTDVGGLWYAADKVEKRIQNAPNRLRDQEIDQYLHNIVCRLSREYCKDIRIYTMDYPWFNAFMMPNGVMVVWSGLMLRAESEDQLAFVLAHELGHYTKQHSIESYRKQKSAENWLSALTIVSPTAGLVGAVSATGVLLKYSRDFEREADNYGIQRTEATGLNPGAGAKLFQRLKQEEDASDVEKRGIFLSTHPATEERIITISSFDNGITEDTETAHRFYEIQDRYLARWLKMEIAKRNYSGTEVLLKNLLNHQFVSGFRQYQLDYFTGELYRRRAQKGDLERAIDSYIAASNFAESEPLIFQKLGRLEELIGRTADAIKHYERYLSLVPDSAESALTRERVNKLKEKST